MKMSVWMVIMEAVMELALILLAVELVLVAVDMY